ncbi:MAG: epoxyqueuosine reductase QueH [Cellulosilyticaceae bacterium]
MNKINYQILLEKKIQQLEKDNSIPKLLLHSCCAPCSSYVIAYLSNYFEITVFYYNPNIDEVKEYQKRAAEQEKLITKMNTKYPVSFLEGEYDVERYAEKAEPLSKEKEGGARCSMCYYMRLEKTAEVAKSLRMDYFTTTLSISPMKDAVKLNQIGKILEEKYNVPYLYSDFKKKEGYKKSIELSQEYNLYRQNYCGCSYSKKESQERETKQ